MNYRSDTAFHQRMYLCTRVMGVRGSVISSISDDKRREDSENCGAGYRKESMVVRVKN